jgi:hypothetical protein
MERRRQPSAVHGAHWLPPVRRRLLLLLLLLLLLCLQSSLGSRDGSTTDGARSGSSSGCPPSPRVRVVVHYMLWFSPE